jgi:Protein of unknown function (DUF1580)
LHKAATVAGLNFQMQGSAMPIDLRDVKSLITFGQLAHLLPPGRNGRPVHISTIHRWALKGVRTSRGRIRLDAVRCSSRWMTTWTAWEEFVQAQTPDLADRPQLPRTSTARQRAVERADRQLEKIGI